MKITSLFGPYQGRKTSFLRVDLPRFARAIAFSLPVVTGIRGTAVLLVPSSERRSHPFRMLDDGDTELTESLLLHLEEGLFDLDLFPTHRAVHASPHERYMMAAISHTILLT